MAQLAAGGESADDLASALCAELTETLGLRGCTFERPPFTSDLPRMGPTGSVSESTHYFTHEGFELPRDGAELPVVAGGRTVGRFVLTPSPGAGIDIEHRMVAVALADQLGVVLAQQPSSPSQEMVDRSTLNPNAARADG